MKCITKECKGRTKVLETRKLGEEVERRRECMKCGVKFVTHEAAAWIYKPAPLGIANG